MSTSELGYFSRIPSTIADADKPISTGQFRFLLNNIMHTADESWNVLINWSMRATNGLEVSSTGTDRWRRIISFPVTLSMKQDGTHYPLVIQLGGSADAKASAEVKFRASLSRPEQVSSANSVDYDGHAVDTNTVTVTKALLTTSPKHLTMETTNVGLCVRQESTLDEIGGVEHGAKSCQAMLTIWGSTTNAGSDIRLYAVYAREFVGA